MYENRLSPAARNALCWIGATLLVGVMWTLPGWLIVLGVI